ncbi:MAG TPA: alpha/beta hydrolase [Bacteroidia bacterium]|jgi:pimeloyl-ACP methyl ester carboxylesterase|nr:alpha/beta hydrolase [Bacteroidia bacterium]
MTNSRHIVFIHGLFQNPASWQKWKKHFGANGFTCHTPAYPFHDGDPATLRKEQDPHLGKLTFGGVTAHLAKFIDTLPEKPILVGHSMGGLAVQKLIALEKGVMGVCIDTAPPKGIFSFKWSFLRANLPTVNPLKGNSICLPDVKWFQYAFCNTMSLAETQKEYDAFVVPESRNIPRSSTKKDGKIDFSKPHAPLLFIAGEKDHIIPSSLNRKNFDAYKDTTSRKEFKEFPGRTHYICGQKNWEEVAEYISEWITRN